LKKKKTKKTDTRKQGLIDFIRFLALILPLVLYLVTTVGLYPAPNSGFLVLGYVGCFVLGLGFVNIVGLLDEMYLGHVVSAILLSLGIGLVATSSAIIYVPQLYSQINEEAVTFYFVIWTMIVLSVIYYCFFRGAVRLYLQEMGLSKTAVKKAKEGKRNYWWYEELNQQIGLSWIYYVNKVYTLLFLFAVAFQIFLGWWSVMFPVTMAAAFVLLALDIPMYYLVFSTWHLAQTKAKKSSHLALLAGFILPISACIGLVLLFIKLQ
jgi:hypothetical protein